MIDIENVNLREAEQAALAPVSSRAGQMNLAYRGSRIARSEEHTSELQSQR